MAYFPMFVDLRNRSGLIVGGGVVALHKVEKLLPYGPRLTAIAPELLPELLTVPDLQLQRRPFRIEDLNGADFVIAASDDRELNHAVADQCWARKIPVNVVDDKGACSFLFPALVQRGDLSVGISTGGASPTAAIWLKNEITALLPQGLDEILVWLESQRSHIKALCPDETARARIFARLFTACLETGTPLSESELADLLEREELK